MISFPFALCGNAMKYFLFFLWGRVAHDSISGATDMRIQKLMKAPWCLWTPFFLLRNGTTKMKR